MTHGLLAAIENNWPSIPIKHATTMVSRGSAPDYVDEGPIRVLNQASNQENGFDWNRSRFHSSSGDSTASRGRLLPGDVVVNSTGIGTIGRVGFFSSSPDLRPCMADGHLTIVRADHSILHPRFLFYWLTSKPFQMYLHSALVDGATNQIELNRERLAAAPIPIVPLDEQAQIVRFLNSELSTVSNLVTVKQRLKARLNERTTSSLVKTTLNDPTQDWRRTRLKYLFSSVQSGAWGEDATGTSSDVTCVRVADFDRHNFLAGSTASTRRSIPSEQLQNRLLQPGDVLLEKSGGGDHNPVGFAVTFDGAGRSVCSNFVAALRVADGVNARFACLLLAAHYRARLNTPYIKQSTGIQNLDGDQYLGQWVSVPDEREQARTAEALDRQIFDVDSLRSNLDNQLSALTERRDNLIASAVTGQIDVSTSPGADV